MATILRMKQKNRKWIQKDESSMNVTTKIYESIISKPKKDKQK